MTNSTRTGILLLALAQGLAGCGRSGSSPAPSAPSPVPQSVPGPIPIAPAGVVGDVSDTAFRPLVGASVEVLDGPQAGTSTTTDATGSFSLTGVFDSTTRFRASKNGYVGATQSWTCSAVNCLGVPNARPWVGFYLAVVTPPVNIAGDYTLIFVADSACTQLPNELRTRTYGATITLAAGPNAPANTSFNVALSGASFLADYTSFPIGVAGDFVRFLFGHDGPGIVEQVAPNAYLELDGLAEATVGPSPVSTISTSFDGSINYCALRSAPGSYFDCIPSQAVAHTECQSKNHRLILTRR